jgi:hypothetical protein
METCVLHPRGECSLDLVIIVLPPLTLASGGHPLGLCNIQGIECIQRRATIKEQSQFSFLHLASAQGQMARREEQVCLVRNTPPLCALPSLSLFDSRERERRAGWTSTCHDQMEPMSTQKHNAFEFHVVWKWELYACTKNKIVFINRNHHLGSNCWARLRPCACAPFRPVPGALMSNVYGDREQRLWCQRSRVMA